MIVTFNYSINEINIFTDGGRCCRPLYIVEDNKLRITKDDIENLKKKYVWNNLVLNNLNNSCIHSKNNYSKNVKEGLIEYLDSEESYNSLIMQ